MEVKGEAILSIPIFILKKIGSKGYNRWLDLISPEAKKVYSRHSPYQNHEGLNFNKILLVNEYCHFYIIYQVFSIC